MESFHSIKEWTVDLEVICLQTKKNLNQNRKYNSHAENECRCCLTAIRYNTAKTWRSMTNCNLAKISASKEIFPWTIPTMLPFCLFQRKCYPDDHKPNWQSQLQLTISTMMIIIIIIMAIMQISFFLVILISIIIDTWQIWKSFHLIRIITTQHLG